MKQTVTVDSINAAAKRIDGIARKTPLEFSKRLSEKYKAKIYLKREDLQEIRSYKIRGAYNLMSGLTPQEKKQGVVCNSAGNHAQGVALSASLLKIHAWIFMPAPTPLQKVEKVRHFGGKYATVELVGQTFDDAYAAANEFCKKKKAVFVSAINDARAISGQGTVGKEVYDQLKGKLDVVIVPVGGGGIVSGSAVYCKEKNKRVKIIGVEPKGAACMDASIKAGKVVTLDEIDTFVDGAAMKRVGDLSYELTKKYVDDILVIPEGQVCSTIIEMYQYDGIIAEPAGALSIAALDDVAEKIKGKTVVCIISGGNNDMMRYPEIIERSLMYQGLKHYFIVEFAQKPGQLKLFVEKVLGPNDDITRVEYIKKNARNRGPMFFGVEFTNKEDWPSLTARMDSLDLRYTVIKSTDLLYSYLV